MPYISRIIVAGRDHHHLAELMTRVRTKYGQYKVESMSGTSVIVHLDHFILVSQDERERLRDLTDLSFVYVLGHG